MIVDPVTEDEVFERLRAHLGRQGIALHRGSLDGMAKDDRGRFFTTVGASDGVSDRHVNIERLARQEGLLHPNEAIVPSKGEVR
jgi:hypothetical protein